MRFLLACFVLVLVITCSLPTANASLLDSIKRWFEPTPAEQMVVVVHEPAKIVTKIERVPASGLCANEPPSSFQAVKRMMKHFQIIGVPVPVNQSNCSICELMVGLAVYDVEAMPNTLQTSNFTTSNTTLNVLYQICQLPIFQSYDNSANVTCVAQARAYNQTIAYNVLVNPLPYALTPWFTCTQVGECSA